MYYAPLWLKHKKNPVKHTHYIPASTTTLSSETRGFQTRGSLICIWRHERQLKYISEILL